MPRRRAWLDTLVSILDAGGKRVYTKSDLRSLVESGEARNVAIPRSLSLLQLIKTLEQRGVIKEAVIAAVPADRAVPDILPLEGTGPANRTPEADAAPYEPFVRYTLSGATPFEVAVSLRSKSYLSHATAVFFHGLTSQIPRTVFVNREQTTKPSSEGPLSQDAIDRAFRNRGRVSRYVFAYEAARIVLLSGKNSGNLEVSEFLIPGSRSSLTLPVTKLERTLIDIVVRPAYSGGVFEVLEAYIGARDMMSVPTLLATLKRLDYVYPYHQAIGFYMERAGYSTPQIQRLQSIGALYDFYLTNRIPEAVYDSKWRVYYPKGLGE